MDWMRSVDDRQTDLRELHELTTARFEARLDGFEARVNQQFAEFRGEMNAGFAQVRNDMSGLELRFERRFNDLMKWSFVFWIGSLLTLVATLTTLHNR